MRELGLKDAFAFSRILKSADLKSTISDFAKEIATRKKSDGKVNLEEVGLEFFVNLIISISDEKVEQKIYKFLSEITELEENEIANANFKKLKQIILEIIQINDLKSFFQSASALM